MTQKEAIQNIFDTLDNKKAIKEFVTYWLHDINWHTEADLFDKQYNPQQIAPEYKLDTAQKITVGLNYIYGWGLDHSWLSGGRGQAFVDELQAMIND